MHEYEAIGTKEDDYREYQSISFIDRNIESYYQEDVDSYSSAIIGRIFRWV